VKQPEWTLSADEAEVDTCTALARSASAGEDALRKTFKNSLG